MRKYWTILKLELQKGMQYRFNFFASIVSNSFILIFFFYFWIKIYSEGNKIGSYDLRSLLTYYFLAVIIGSLLFLNLGWIISDEIREGRLTNFILKPLNYLINNFAKYWGALCGKLIYYIPIIAIAFIFLRRFFIYPLNLVQWMFFLLSFILASLLYFLIFYIIGLTSFWLGMIQGFSYGFMVFTNFMGGKYLPLDLLPTWFVKINVYLPFQYMTYEPVSIFLNKINFNYFSLFVPVVWIIILFALSCFVWKRGIIVYEAYGA
ncbi:ABC transporter permease [Patescibacteria group bacterium]